MITCPTVRKDLIRYHYNLSTVFYRLLWGPHIHHGLWSGDEPIAQAQIQLTQRLAQEAGVQPGDRILDVGCGMGGSTNHLARQFNCHATGITVSSLQAHWATWSARLRRLTDRANFLCQDVEQAEFEPNSFDVVWSIECTEHLFDKPTFFSRAARWVRPGGRIAICAWLAGDELKSETDRQQVFDVCEGFFCPSLGSAADYVDWLQSAGMEMTATYDWTDSVMRTWEICRDRIRRTGIRHLARLIDQDTVLFLDCFDTILNAYRTGAMRYGCFVAEKPTTSPD
ncbi:MAG: class I SAM-dependent methyltransferase [Planctomycetales bacterium]|nr:class I SAM-dependent methyltransferase [Planctomycetales bacterium]